MVPASEGFRGSKRFVVEGRVGAGGMGVVHRARDLERGDVLVALKTMVRVEPEALLRFKKEFRALADISHPNVVQLYELFSEGEQWFFTMELLDGVDLLTWVQSSLTLPPPPAPSPASSGAAASPADLCATMLAGSAFFDSIRPAAGEPPSTTQPQRPREEPAVRTFPVRDVERLRDAFRQLASGLMAIHAAGKLHRDVKPSNVIVTREGRVVLLDFGVASDLADRVGHGVEYAMAGTPAYMAPEQATLSRATPASDWYAVGVVLYEALATRLPFEGSAPAILFGKQQRQPVPPSAHVEGIPEDLEQLAMDLLQPDPRSRPTGEQILARLEGQRTSFVSSPGEASFVGRRTQLEELREAYRASATSLGVVMLHGRSGMGKTALASRFLAELMSSEEVLVLSGRCYERETVPFKAVDSVVDELRHWLSRLPENEVAALLPPDLSVLSRVFPVLGDLENGGRDTTASNPPGRHDHIEAHELRRRAFIAMKELLGNIAKQHRLVVHIDDLQWCDADSVQLLEVLLAAPSPPWLLLCTYRSELGHSSAPLADLQRAIELLESHCAFREVEVKELAAHEAEELARTLVGSGDAEVAALVTAEGCGNPLFLAELARWANERLGTARGSRGLSLEQVILDRVSLLPDDARGLLETLSVAGGPLTHAVAARAAEHASAGAGLRTPALALRSARLVVTRGLGDDDSIEPAHDRVRETIAQSLDDGRRKACHAGIARALAEETSQRDPEAIFEHFRAAGDEDRARAFVLAAAGAADGALAFLRAASLYRAAIELRAGPLEVLHRKLGDAFANAGHLADAADAYLAGARHAGVADALELRRLAAEDYLKSGRDARGLEVMRSVLDEVDLPYARSKQGALASLLLHEAKLRVAPLRRRLRPAQSVDSAHLARIDVAFAAATGISMSDPLRGADYASRGLLLALEASEPVRLCRALAVAAGNAATRGEQARARAEDLVRAAERIAREIDEPKARAQALLAAGTVHFLLGEWRSARSKLESADRVLREGCRAVAWELANTQSWTCNVLILSGDLSEASKRVPALMDEARSREDRFAMMHLSYPACIAHIVADDVDGALQVANVRENAHPDVLTAGRWGAFISACSVDRYRGDGAAAWRRVERQSRVLESSMLWRSAMVRVFSSYERGLSAIASASASASARHDRKRALDAAQRWSKALMKEKLRYAPALGHLLRAGVSAANGDGDAALGALDAAIPKLDEADLGYLAACARHRKGELVGGAAGRELLERSTAFFCAQGIVSPTRCLAMSAPGF
jgi:serine/threonine protein kinase/tetratricopeptide (TPR) repeat protein